MKLGKIEEVDIRDVWAHEQYDFSKWLAEEENIQTLGEVLNLSLTDVNTEQFVGSYRCDIICKDELTGKSVLIENQLEQTNHDHLGKIITYASGLDASVVVWIVANARDEHASAIEWLNNHTDDNVSFFLIEIHAYKIGDSAPAPMFKIVEQPNDFVKSAKALAEKGELNETQKYRLDFWTKLNDLIDERGKPFNKHKPSTDHWYTVAVGSSKCYISIDLVHKEHKIARYISYVFTPIVLFSTYFLTLQEAVVAGRRIENFFSTSEDKNEDGKCITHINKIELRNISYRYNENADYVFENADIVIDSKDKMCIYGENGSGKTTLIKLITGLINPTGGEIYINNIPLKEINITSVRKRIGVVSQNSYIFSGSLIENIASSSEELVLWSSICDNEVFSGIDWKRGIVIENGKNLSSGQKQKIALARMLVKNPDVIVIDEGITNLDAESKEIILKAADTLFKDKICIFVSHSDDFSAISKRKLIIKNKKLMNCYGSLKRFR